MPFLCRLSTLQGFKIADPGQEPLIEIDAAVLHSEGIETAFLPVFGPLRIAQLFCRHKRSPESQGYCAIRTRPK